MLSDWRARIRLSIVLAAAALAGCASVSYLTQAAHGEWQILHARQPIARVIANPGTSPPLRSRLQLVEDARQFAVTALHLPDNASYRSYTDLHRPYVTWDVVAAPRFSVHPLRWCFPVAGCVNYRGYFHQRAARAFAAHLAARGDDVDIEGVTAYSTLGHLPDPVLSTMMHYGELDLVGTLFHELAHQLLYVPGDSRFDESFAMTVQAEGVARWLAAHGRSAELQRYLDEQRVQDRIDHVFVSGRARLARLYAEPLSPARMASEKQAILKDIAARALAIERQQPGDPGDQDWLRSGLNNASLALMGTYADCVPGFEGLLRKSGGDLPRFYAAARAASRSAQRRHQLCNAGAGAGQVTAATTR